VKVSSHDAERGTERRRSPEGCRGHIGEGAVAAIPVQPVRLPIVMLGTAVAAAVGQDGALALGAEVVADVVAHVEIEPSVAVVVEERGGHSPAGRIDAARARYV